MATVRVARCEVAAQEPVGAADVSVWGHAAAAAVAGGWHRWRWRRHDREAEVQLRRHRRTAGEPRALVLRTGIRHPGGSQMPQDGFGIPELNYPDGLIILHHDAGASAEGQRGCMRGCMHTLTGNVPKPGPDKGVASVMFRPPPVVLVSTRVNTFCHTWCVGNGGRYLSPAHVVGQHRLADVGVHHSLQCALRTVAIAYNSCHGFTGKTRLI